MAVHMVRVVCEPPKGDAETAIKNWVENYTEWTADTVEHSLIESNTSPDGSGTDYLIGSWRFEQNSESATEILTNLSERLQKIQDGLWHRLVYHICSHDKENPDSCSWDEKQEFGTIPNGTPDYTVI